MLTGTVLGQSAPVSILTCSVAERYPVPGSTDGRVVGNGSVSSWLRGLADSALMVAAFGGLLYLIGYQVQRGDAISLGIPMHLLPEASTESILTDGFLTGVLFLGFLLLVYLLLLLVLRCLPQSSNAAVGQYFRTAVSKHPRFYTLFGFFCAVAIMSIVANRIPVRSIWASFDRPLPKVSLLKLKDGRAAPDIGELRFLSRRDGWIILKRVGKNEYLLLREDNVESLSLQSE